MDAILWELVFVLIADGSGSLTITRLTSIY